MGIRLLLDTHALVWWWTDDPRLPRASRDAIAATDSVVHVSAASAWEMATKHRLGKWPEIAIVVAQFDELVRRSRLTPLAITTGHALLAGGIEGTHRDPFDRILLTQARHEQLTIVSADPVFRAYGATVLWQSAPTATTPEKI